MLGNTFAVLALLPMLAMVAWLFIAFTMLALFPRLALVALILVIFLVVLVIFLVVLVILLVNAFTVLAFLPVMALGIAGFVLSGYQISLGWDTRSNGDVDRAEDDNEECQKAKIR